MMQENGYINATKLCQLGNAIYRKWSRLVGAQILINEFQAAISGPLEINEFQSSTSPELKILINGGENQSVWGTYVHPF